MLAKTLAEAAQVVGLNDAQIRIAAQFARLHPTWEHRAGKYSRREFSHPSQPGKILRFSDPGEAALEHAKLWRLKIFGGTEFYGEALEEIILLGRTALELGLSAREVIELARLKAHEIRQCGNVGDQMQLRSIEAVEAFLLTKSQRGCRARTESDSRSRLRRFARDLPGPVAEIRASDVQRWFLNIREAPKLGRAAPRAPGQLLAPRTRNNFLFAVQDLFNNAPELKKLPHARDICELKPIELGKHRKSIWTPAELFEILAEAQRSDHGVIPALSLCAFAGLRTSEALRLDAADLRLKAKRPDVIIESSKTKVKKERTVELPPNLVKWLRCFGPRSGPLWAGHENTYHKRLRNLCARVGLIWRKNALRRSWTTYWDAQHHDAKRQSALAGNSESMRETHYNNPRAAEPDAWELWFAIHPGDGIQGVLPFPALPKPCPNEHAIQQTL